MAKKELMLSGRKKSREESFGKSPGDIAVSGGTMHLFGFKTGEGVWPGMPVSVDQKTGYPKNFDGKTKSIKP